MPAQRQERRVVPEQRDGAPRDVVGQRTVLARSDHLAQRVEIDQAVERHTRPRLLLQRTTRCRIDAGLRDLPSLDGGEHRIDRLRRITRLEDDVRARLHGQHRALFHAVSLAYAFHGHRVGDGDAAERQRVAKHAGDDARRERGWRGGVAFDGRERDVRGHHHPGAGLDSGAKRDELQRGQARPVRADDRQPHMRIHVGVAVPGEVLRRGDRAADLRAAHERRREPRDPLRVLTERASVDDGVRRVVVDVHGRGEVDLNPDGARLLPDDLRDVVRILVPARGGDRHRARKDGCAPCFEQVVREHAALETSESRLEVGRRQQRHARQPLHVVDLGRDFDGGA